jgi:hypothetical protein
VEKQIIVIYLLLLALIPFVSGHVFASSNKLPIFHLKNPSPKADFNRLPVFYTSDPEFDAFVNEWFIRHLSVEPKTALHDYGKGVILGAVEQLWCVEWDAWFLPWIDRGAMGLERQGNSPIDWQYYYLLHVPIDKYGYVWGSVFIPEPKNSLGGWRALFGWPWPKYNRDTTSTLPHGWEFNDINDGARESWKAYDVELLPGYVDYSLCGKITGPHPALVSPKFDVDVYQVPIVELDITYKAPPGKSIEDIIDGLRIYWTTNDSETFGDDKMVTSDFADLPPKRFSEYYTSFVTADQARYVLYFPMYLHPKWGREGRRITQLQIIPASESYEGVEVSLNYVRATYDVRLHTTNAILINSAFRYYMWSGDKDFLRAVMPRLRKALIYMNEHLGGRKYGLIHSGWMVGKDGLGGVAGRSLIGSYWDLLPVGVYDLESSVSYYSALCAMSELEKIVPKPTADDYVVGPDNQTLIYYRETPESLMAQARRVKARIEEVFWVKETGRFCKAVDVNGVKHDYGFLHFNLWAMAQGIGTPLQRQSVLSWLDGTRKVAGDTSTGEDIYHWRFAPRTSTKRNTSWYYWPWVDDWKNCPPEWKYSREWGNQMQDGGAVGMTALFDLMLRISTGKQEDIDKAFLRTKAIQAWFREVKTAGGEGREFYRKYYEGHPERGILQSPKPGGLGLDREFLSDGSLGTAFIPLAFLGLKADKEGVLSVTPAVPSSLSKIGVRNVFYRGNHLTIEAGKNYVSFHGSRIPNGTGLKALITFKNPPSFARVLVDGSPLASGVQKNADGSISVKLDLRPVTVKLEPAPKRK